MRYFAMVMALSGWMAILSLPLGCARQPSELLIAERGRQTRCVLVVPAQMTPCEKTASEELVLWTERLTGVKLDTVSDEGPFPEFAIVFGRSRQAASLLGAGADRVCGLGAFRLKCDGRHVLVDGDDAGVLYGVYELLHRFGGIEWYTDSVYTLSENRRLAVPNGLDLSVKPSIPVRDPGHRVFSTGLAAARMRVNGLHTGGRNKQFGGCPFRWNAKFPHCHSMKSIASKEEFATVHPEYFEKDEKGVPNLKWPPRPQLCLTEPGVLKLAKKRLGEQLEEDREATLFGISQEDYETWCKCPRCKARTDAEGGACGTLVPFLNELADLVAERRPDACLTTLAYHLTRTPPKTLKLRKNVLVGLCLTECDFSRPLVGHPNQGNQTFLEAFEKWSSISGGVWIWDYCTDYEWHAFPMPNVRALAENIRLYAKWGVRYVYEESYWTPFSYFDELKAYVCSKLMWDASLPLDPLVDGFLKACYGPAAGKVREIYEMYENHPRDLQVRMGYEVHPHSDMFPDGLHDRAAHLWTEAEELVGGQEPYADFVKRGKFGNETVRLVRYLFRLKRDGHPTPSDAETAKEMRRIAVRMLKIEENRLQDKDEKGRRSPKWGWGWSWMSRKNYKPLVEALAAGRPLP